MGESSTSCLHDEGLPCAARPRNPAEPRVRRPEVSALPQHPLCALSLQNKGATGGFSLVCQEFDNAMAARHFHWFCPSSSTKREDNYPLISVLTFRRVYRNAVELQTCN